MAPALTASMASSVTVYLLLRVIDVTTEWTRVWGIFAKMEHYAKRRLTISATVVDVLSASLVSVMHSKCEKWVVKINENSDFIAPRFQVCFVLTM